MLTTKKICIISLVILTIPITMSLFSVGITLISNVGRIVGTYFNTIYNGISCI